MDQLSSQREPVVVGVVGDRHERFAAQDSIETALEHSAGALGTSVRVEWFDTAGLAGATNERLAHADGVWCAPGGPFVSMEGALEGIRFARESGRPFLGTCAGFQHGVIEFARNVLGIGDAQHAEYGVDADAGAGSGRPPLLIDELLCSLVGQAMTVRLVEPSTCALYGATEAVEEYYCRFGLNETYVPALAEAGLVVAGVDQLDGTTRVMHIAEHPFFYLTLFVPQAGSTPERPHPIVTGYVAAVLERRRARVE